MNNCMEVQKNISAYIDKEANPSLSRLIDGHLKDCQTCRKIFEDFQNIDFMLKGLPADSPSPDFAGHVVNKLRISLNKPKLPPIEKIAVPGSVRIDKSEPLPDLSIRQEHRRQLELNKDFQSFGDLGSLITGRFNSLIKLFEEFFELLESHTNSHKSLDEFSDSPPFSMSHIYFNLLHPTT